MFIEHLRVLLCFVNFLSDSSSSCNLYLADEEIEAWYNLPKESELAGE